MSHRCLCSHGYIVHKKLITNIQLNKILHDLTITPKGDPFFAEYSPPTSFPIFLYDDEAYYLPRYWAERVFGPPKFIQLPAGDPIALKIKFDPLPHQYAAWNSMLKQFVKGKQIGGGGVLSLPCGYGKTYLAIRLIVHLGLKALVVVNQEFFMDQWEDAIHEYSDASVGFIQGKTIDVKGKQIVLGMLQSISSDRDYGDLFDQFGIVVIDEVHHIGSEKFSRALPKIHTKFMLGLSATPNRVDGTSDVFYHTIGPLFHSEKRNKNNNIKIVQLMLKSRTDHYQRITMRSPSGKVRVNTKKMISNLVQYKARNQIMLELIVEMLKNPARQILVLSERREHLHWFGAQLDELYKDGEPIYGYYYGRKGQTKEKCREQRKIASTRRVVLGTIQLAKEGLNIPTLNCLIFASPPGRNRDIIDQAVGRILRKFHFDHAPTVFDLVDDCGNFVKSGQERFKYYQSMGYQLTASNPITIGTTLSTINKAAVIEAITKKPSTKPTIQQKTEKEEKKPRRRLLRVSCASMKKKKTISTISNSTISNSTNVSIEKKKSGGAIKLSFKKKSPQSKRTIKLSFKERISRANFKGKKTV